MEKKLLLWLHGMGMPSMGIYSYELFKFYDVENIIRLGSCGGYNKDLNLFDLVIIDNSYTEGNYALSINNSDCHLINSSAELNSVIEDAAKNINIQVRKANIACGEVFDAYMSDMSKYLARLPKEYNIAGAEMEAFALFYNAKLLNKKASCILTVVDSYFYNENISADARQNSLNQMIKLGLESAIRL